MESALPGPDCVEDGGASQQQQQQEEEEEELPRPEEEEEKLQSETENGSCDEPERDEDEDDYGEEAYESCAGSSARVVTGAGQMNGGGATARSNAALKMSSKSLAFRTGRRNQEVKDRSNFICPLCDKNCMTQHQLTMHIRQHNTEVGGTDHSCSICGKALSSASSLDRHMLVHSGERPYKCSVCGQTFTTNGNMHRHMKIHDKEATGAPASRPTSPNKRRKTKRKLSVEEEAEKIDEPPNKKIFIKQQPEEELPAKREEDLLHCPICFKTFICKYGLESHMETHPDTALKCNLCCVTFRTHRGLLRHNSVIHKQLPTDPTGRPFIQTNPSIPLGFSDLSFIDFSCHKFPRIAQVWCETNLRRCASKFHRFVCEVCNKAFPLQVSLDLHTTSHNDSKKSCAELQKQEDDTNSHASKDGSDFAPTEERAQSVPKQATSGVNGKADFMESLGLQLSSLVKPAQSEEEIQQGILDSIRFIRVEPSIADLPQETNGSLGLCLINPVSIQGLNEGNGLSLVSLQPLQGGLVVQPVSQNGVELANIQILKLTASMPPQVPLVPNALESPVHAGPKQIAPLKPKPLVTPRSSMGISTPPPPVMNAQQASSGCISPNLPPLAAQQLLTSKQSANTPSSSTSSSPTNWESTRVGRDCTGTTITEYNSFPKNIKQNIKQGHSGNEKDVKTSSGKKTEYPCRFCSQIFSFPGGLQAHVRAHHSGASPYKCSICTYSAPDNATLMRHLRTHSGERPYVCRLCHYPFTVKANCERHLRKKHMKNNRKDIEKNIEYVTTSSNVSGVIGGTTLDLLESPGIGTTCRYCGENLKSYRALQIHLRTLNGCQRKPFECRECGLAFFAKRNCIHHLLKQHSDIPEKEIEEHINTLVPLTAASSVQANPIVTGGSLPSDQPQAHTQDLSTFSEDAEQNEPLDFSKKMMKTVGSDMQPEATPSVLPLDDCSMEPIDLSMPKIKEGKKARTGVVNSTSLLLREIKKDVTSLSADKSAAKCSGVQAAIPVSIPSIASTLPGDVAKPFTRLKPLRPKPIAVSNTSEMPPLASIAQIISSVSAAPVLFKTGIKAEKSDSSAGGETPTDKCSNGAASPESFFILSTPDASKKRGKKRSFKEELHSPTETAVSGLDLESSEEFPSVERMLATTDSNKFSPYLQARQVDPDPCASDEEKEEKEGKPKVQSQSKGKKNAYSNSVQKMKCPYCPRVFPWTSSLQRHMLTHTGQKPFPCPQCDAFFSTKSNCERHLLRKHGVSNRSTLLNTELHPKPKADDGSQGSTEHFSDTGDVVSPKNEEDTTASEEILPEQPEEQPECQKDLQISESTDISKNSDDLQSKKGLEMNTARKLIESKPTGTEQHKLEGKEPVVEPASSASDEFPHTCSTCKKTFRHAATLIRHQNIHIQDTPVEGEDKRVLSERPVESSQPISTSTLSGKEAEQAAGSGGKEDNSTGAIVESGTEDEGKEARNEEDCGISELRGVEEQNESGRGRSDKRKKICSMCSKRFWSLQDLTRHMRSHTGERPYQCQTCDRTFTLKHSLVRHQRIHQKAPDRSDDPEEADGAREDSAGEELRGSSGSESEAPSTASSETHQSEAGNAQAAKRQKAGTTGTKEEVSTEDPEEAQSKEDCSDPSPVEKPEPKEIADNQGASDV